MCNFDDKKTRLEHTSIEKANEFQLSSFKQRCFDSISKSRALW